MLQVPVGDPSGLLAGHYPRDPLVPGVVLIDAIGSALARFIDDDDMAALVGVEGLRLQRRLVPSDRLAVEAERVAPSRWRIKVAVDSAPAARFSLMLGPRPSAPLPSLDHAAAAGTVPLSSAAILARLPHRAPMLLVDRACRHDGGIDATYAVTTAAPWFAGADPASARSASILPRAIALESFLQASGLLFAADDAPDASLIFSGASDIRFHGDARLGDTLVHRLRPDRLFDGAALLSGTIALGDRLLASIDQVLVALRAPGPVLVRGAEGVLA